MTSNQPIIYFAAAIKGDISRKAIFKDIITILQKHGAKVLTEHFALENPNMHLAEFLGKKYIDLVPEDIEKQDLEWVGECSHLVAEISGASMGVGREIEYARSKHLHGKRPAKILCLYAHDANPTWMITGMTPDRYPNVKIAKYQNLEEIDNIVKQFLT